jgi:hypothetical protein
METLFGKASGFVGVRTVRKMCFVDFDSIKASTAAMVKYQSYRLHADHAGLTIDYDKDAGVARKRKAEDTQARESRLHQAQSSDYYCSACGTKALQTDGKLLSALPTRGTDGAVVVDEGQQLAEARPALVKRGVSLLHALPTGVRHVNLASYAQLLLDDMGEPLRIKRAKGVERQYRLCCRSCRQPIGYRSTPTCTDGSFLYVIATCLVDHVSRTT